MGYQPRRDLPESLAESMDSTLQHIAIIQAKESRLEEARHEALAQTLHRIGSAHRAGSLSDVQLCTAFESVQQIKMTGRMQAWNAHIDIGWKRMVQVLKRLPNGPEGTWIGPNPTPYEHPTPLPGTPVVYVLFGRDNEPCYVGSTNAFTTRMTSHRRDGKEFAHWQAYPCRDREHAYQVEERLLQERLPHLNRKASR